MWCRTAGPAVLLPHGCQLWCVRSGAALRVVLPGTAALCSTVLLPRGALLDIVLVARRLSQLRPAITAVAPTKCGYFFRVAATAIEEEEGEECGSWESNWCQPWESTWCC